jgi:putative NADH-flavin reductase
VLVNGTGGTGKHFVSQALKDGHRVRALVRNPAKVEVSDPNLELHTGSITNITDISKLVQGTDSVVVMLGDKEAQQTSKINTAFIKQLVPAMRQHGVKRLLYQAGGLSKPHNGELTWTLWILRHTLARSFNGQHLDNEAVMEYLATEAKDIEWMVHRAGIYGDGPSKGRLERSNTTFSIGNFRDCAEYSHRLIKDDAAVHTSDFSCYAKN